MKKMQSVSIPCKACKGTGRWTSPAVKMLDGTTMPEASLQCVSCGGYKEVEFISEQDEQAA